MLKGKLFLCVDFLNKKQGKHVGKRGNGREITHRQDAFGGGAGDDDSRISKCQGEEAAATSVEYFAFPYANFNPESSSHDEEFRRGGGRRGRKMFIITVIRGFPPHILD